MTHDIVERLRDRACPAGLPHTGDEPRDDHGHTDCWLHHLAADVIEAQQAEIARLRALITEWADADDAHGYRSLLKFQLARNALRETVGR